MFGNQIKAAFAAVLLASAVFAASAHAAPEYTGEEGGKNVKTIVDMVGTGDQVFTTPKAKVTCTALSMSTEMATGKATELTGEKVAYSDCTTNVATDTTVTFNTCDFKYTQPVKNGANYKAQIDLSCPKGKVIEIHVYTDKNHTTSLCTITAYPVTTSEEEKEVIEEELEGQIFEENFEEKLEGGGQVISVKGSYSAQNLTFKEDGAKCPDGNNEQDTATAAGDVIIRATNAGGKRIDMKITG
jgi:hypothetical protein